MGDGISSPHAEICLERFPFKHSVAQDSSLRAFATSRDALGAKELLKMRFVALCQSLGTSPHSGRAVSGSCLASIRLPWRGLAWHALRPLLAYIVNCKPTSDDNSPGSSHHTQP
jgi:hypothetical protein